MVDREATMEQSAMVMLSPATQGDEARNVLRNPRAWSNFSAFSASNGAPPKQWGYWNHQWKERHVSYRFSPFWHHKFDNLILQCADLPRLSGITDEVKKNTKLDEIWWTKISNIVAVDVFLQIEYLQSCNNFEVTMNTRSKTYIVYWSINRYTLYKLILTYIYIPHHVLVHTST